METVQKRDPGQEEFHQAVQEVLDTAMPVFKKHPEYIPIMKRMVEPERAVIFRVRCFPAQRPLAKARPRMPCADKSRKRHSVCASVASNRDQTYV